MSFLKIIGIIIAKIFIIILCMFYDQSIIFIHIGFIKLPCGIMLVVRIGDEV